MIRLGLLLITLFTTTLTFGQVKQPVKWTMSQQEISATEFDLVFTAVMEDDWKIYSQHTGDGGPVPTTFEFDEGNHYTRSGAVKEVGKKKEGPDPLFDNITVIKFVQSPVVFTQRVKVKDLSKPITGYLTFMTCNDESCLPPTDVDFSFKLEAKKETSTPTKTPASENLAKEPNKVDPKEAKALDKLNAQEKEPLEQTTLSPPLKNVEDDNEIENPVSWAFSSQKLKESEYELTFVANMTGDWKIYSQFTEEGGPVATSFDFEAGSHYTTVGPVKEIGKKKEAPDPLFDNIKVVKFVESPAIFKQVIQVQDLSQSIKGFLTFMTCDNEKCLPPADVEFAFDLNTGQQVQALPVETVEPTGSSEFGLDYDIVNQTKFDKEWENSDCTDKEIEEKNESSLWLIFLLGFGGGLVALLTPCVFPMIPLTVSFFTKRSKDRATGIRNAFTYGLSIIVIYVTLGLLITGVFGADALNLLSTNAWFNIFFAVLFIVFAFSFFGYFEITLPSSWTNKSDAMADKGGLIGIFFMAFTLSLVSFSCTGPIIGTLLVETATGGGPTILGRIPVGPLMGMFGFSVALALPFALFAAFPSWLNSLPRSGSWMNIVKVTLGFVEIALAFKFLSIADLTMGWKILPYELFVAIWVACAAGLALYFLGFIRFLHDSPVKTLSTSRKVLGTVAVALTIYLLAGFRYSDQTKTFVTPNLLSGLAPPAGHSYIFPNKCPLNINCFKDFETGLAYAKKVKKPILLDFTGHGCVNCRRMEDQVWGQPGIFERINEDYVLVSLYVDDREKLEKPYTSEFSQRPMRTIGNKWADFQAIHFNRNSQPYYVLLSEDGKILNQPRAYTPDVQEYKAFLECGLERYQEYKHLGIK